MRHFCQAENYLSLDTFEFILKNHTDLNVTLMIHEKCYYLHLYTKQLAYYLGTTRRLLRIPLKSKYPHIYDFLRSMDGNTWTRLLHVEMVYSKK